MVSRAVMRAPELWQMVKDRIKPQRDVKGALICLKGDTVEQEFEEVSLHHEVVPLSQWLEEEYFATKCILRIDKSQK